MRRPFGWWYAVLTRRTASYPRLFNIGHPCCNIPHFGSFLPSSTGIARLSPPRAPFTSLPSPAVPGCAQTHIVALQNRQCSTGRYVQCIRPRCLLEATYPPQADLCGGLQSSWILRGRGYGSAVMLSTKTWRGKWIP